MDAHQVKGVVAYACAPHVGGTTTFYRNFARSLRTLGWRVFSVAVGHDSAQMFNARYGDDYSVLLAPQETELVAAVKVFLDWLAQEQVDILIPNNDEIILTAIPHMPQEIRYLTICHSVVRMAYLLSTLYPERLSYAVAINERQVKELSLLWKLPREQVRLIPHGINLERFTQMARPPRSSQELRLIYLGRLNDTDKGVLWIPAMLKDLAAKGIPFSCQLAGSGPDLDNLKKEVRKYGLAGKMVLHGQALPDEVPDLLSQADIFLMPSRFEGVGVALLEAMAAGCVPIATRLQGITDMIIEDGLSGFLCPLGYPRAFAAKLAWLHHNRNLLEEMSAAARRRVAERFCLERMALEYDRLFTEALAQPPVSNYPRALDQLEYPSALLPTWRTKVPMPLKKLARTWLYRLRGRIV